MELPPCLSGTFALPKDPDSLGDGTECTPDNTDPHGLDVITGLTVCSDCDDRCCTHESVAIGFATGKELRRVHRTLVCRILITRMGRTTPWLKVRLLFCTCLMRLLEVRDRTN